jgi:DUF1365 family protein
MSDSARLWFGHTVHTRETPFRRSFRYRIAMIELDIDRLDEAGGLSRFFSIDRPNLVSFRSRDHGARNASIPLRLWAEARFAEAGIQLDGGQIRLVTFPRVLGYGFAPISLWFGHGPDGNVRGVIYEVHNTFGETHAYVSAFDPDQRFETDKEFYVSPFFDVDGGYRFTVRPPGEDMQVVVENLGPDGRQHVASLTAWPRPLTGWAVLRWLLAMPFSAIGVIFAIHWQALALWMKGVRYHIKPIQRARRTTLARLEHCPADAHEDLRKRA